MMLASLGLFVFETLATAFDSVERTSSYRYATGNTVGVRPRLQYIGQDNDTLTLPGTLYPEVTDDPSTLDTLRRMATTGKLYALLDGTGYHYGMYYITEIKETRSYLKADGTPRKIEFSVSLKLQDDFMQEDVATLSADQQY